MIVNPIINDSIMHGSLAVAQSNAVYGICSFQVSTTYSEYMDVSIKDNGNSNIFIVLADSGKFFLAIPKLDMSKVYTVETENGRTISFKFGDGMANTGYKGIRIWFKLISGSAYSSDMYVITTLY